MKKVYSQLELKLIAFESADVITTSGGTEYKYDPNNYIGGDYDVWW